MVNSSAKDFFSIPMSLLLHRLLFIGGKIYWGLRGSVTKTGTKRSCWPQANTAKDENGFFHNNLAFEKFETFI